MKRKYVLFSVLFFVLLSVFISVLIIRLRKHSQAAAAKEIPAAAAAAETAVPFGPGPEVEKHSAEVLPEGEIPASPAKEAAENRPKTENLPKAEPVRPESCAFRLEILGTTVPIAYGVEEETLDRSPGWLTTSAFPGTEGICIIYGHRNRNHLKVLKDIDYGDRIRCILESGECISYLVESIDILESESDLRIPLLDGQHMLLMTCYPFYYTGHAPQKFVCILRREQ